MYPILSANDLKNKILLLTVISKKIKITKYLAQFYKWNKSYNSFCKYLHYI